MSAPTDFPQPDLSGSEWPEYEAASWGTGAGPHVPRPSAWVEANAGSGKTKRV